MPEAAFRSMTSGVSRRGSCRSDLTPYLSGDAIKDYPFLAAIPTFAWQNAGCAFGGHLYMLPLERYVAGRAFFKNTTFYDAEVGKDYVPKDAADLKRVFQQLNRPQEERYATAAYQNTGMHILGYAAMFGAPNNWARRPLADNDQILKDWVANGGDQIRKELLDAMAAAGK